MTTTHASDCSREPVSDTILLMIVWLSMRWWYGAGWSWAWRHALVVRLKSCMDAFSLGPLARSLFAPFKQTYSGKVKGTLGEHFRAFIDKSISRVIGFVVRSIIITAGLVSMLFVVASGLAFIAIWALIPGLPIIGIFMTLLGVG